MMFFNLFLDIVKLTIAGLGVVWAAIYMIKPYLERSERLQVLELKKAADNQTLPLRLQAYERVILFIERTNPSNLLLRLNGGAYSAVDLYRLAAQEVREEYQHNITQQIYVSSRAWAVIRRLKDDTLNLLNSTLSGLPENASGMDFNRALLSHLGQLENNPYEIAADMVHRDLEELF
jgi:hypothetical protein